MSSIFVDGLCLKLTAPYHTAKSPLGTSCGWGSSRPVTLLTKPPEARCAARLDVFLGGEVLIRGAGAFLLVCRGAVTVGAAEGGDRLEGTGAHWTEWITMRTFSLLLLVALAALAESGHGKHTKRAKRELLLRSKRRWVLSTIDLREEDPVMGEKTLVSKMYNDKKTHDEHDSQFHLSGKGVDDGFFKIDPKDGRVFLLKKIDREETPHFEMKFEILTDGVAIDDPLTIVVDIEDINDNAPIFKNLPLIFNVKENTKGILPVELDVCDKDQEDTPNSKVTIRMLKQEPAEPKIELKQLNNTRAQLTFKGCFDYDKIKTYKVTVEAKDHGKGFLSSTAVVTLNVVDTNTHPPKFKNKKFYGEVFESQLKKNVLRVEVEDKDTMNTPGWRAKYFFVDKKEEEFFQIETDPKTNEDKSTGTVTLPPIDKIYVTIKMFEVNDAPQFEQEKIEVYLKEEEEPQEFSFKPTVTDPDSDIENIRFVLTEDPAGWLTVDPITGKVRSVKKMDRESPFVEKGIYKAVICAIDDGEPPANSTCSLLFRLGDVNDNKPKLASKSVIMCGNKGNKAMVPVIDPDDPPYSGPFAFSLGGDDTNLEQQWKLDPDVGMEGGLVSLTPLAYGNYSVPLKIEDQQGMGAQDTVNVIVCDCGEADVCPARGPLSTSLGAAVLLLVFICQYGQGAMKHITLPYDEGNQTLMKYNEEGGGAASTAMPTMPWLSSNGVTVTDSLKQASGQINREDQVMIKNVGKYNTAGSIMTANNAGADFHQTSKKYFLGEYLQ
ncbi:unnamed protein product, partial [Pleuronectes platessa]